MVNETGKQNAADATKKGEDGTDGVGHISEVELIKLRNRHYISGSTDDKTKDPYVYKEIYKGNKFLKYFTVKHRPEFGQQQYDHVYDDGVIRLEGDTAIKNGGKWNSNFDYADNDHASLDIDKRIEGKPGNYGKNGNSGSSGENGETIVEEKHIKLTGMDVINSAGQMIALNLTGGNGAKGGNGTEGGKGGKGNNGENKNYWTDNNTGSGDIHVLAGDGGSGGHGGQGGNVEITLFAGNDKNAIENLSIKEANITIKGGKGGDGGNGGKGGKGGKGGDGGNAINKVDSNKYNPKKGVSQGGFGGDAGRGGKGGQAGKGGAGGNAELIFADFSKNTNKDKVVNINIDSITLKAEGGDDGEMGQHGESGEEGKAGKQNACPTSNQNCSYSNMPGDINTEAGRVPTPPSKPDDVESNPNKAIANAFVLNNLTANIGALNNTGTMNINTSATKANDSESFGIKATGSNIVLTSNVSVNSTAKKFNDPKDTGESEVNDKSGILLDNSHISFAHTKDNDGFKTLKTSALNTKGNSSITFAVSADGTQSDKLEMTAKDKVTTDNGNNKIGIKVDESKYFNHLASGGNAMLGVQSELITGISKADSEKFQLGKEQGVADTTLANGADVEDHARYKFSQETKFDNDKIIYIRGDAIKSEQGADKTGGKYELADGKSSILDSLANSGNLDSITNKNLTGANGVNATENGGDASLFGKGGDGQNGSNGGSVEVNVLKEKANATLSGQTTITALAGNGGMGANGGKADGIDHEYAEKYGIFTGAGGKGGDGGDATLTGFKADSKVALNNVNLTLEATAGKGANGGKAGETINDNADQYKGFDLTEETKQAIKDGKIKLEDLLANVQSGGDGLNGKNGNAKVVGIDGEASEISIDGQSSIVVTAKAKAYDKNANLGVNRFFRSATANTGGVMVSAVGIDASGSTLDINEKLNVSANAFVDKDKADDKAVVDAAYAYSIYADGSTINVGADVTLDSKIGITTNGNATNIEELVVENQGSGFMMNNSSLLFTAMQGDNTLLPDGNRSNKVTRAENGRTTYHTFSTDRYEASGKNKYVFYTDLDDVNSDKQTGDSLKVTDSVDFTNLSAMDIKIGQDKTFDNLRKIPPRSTQKIEGKHTLIDLSGVKDKSSADLTQALGLDSEGKTQAKWNTDVGIFKYKWTADIQQDAISKDVILTGLAVNNQLPSNSVLVSLDNSFLVNRMSFLADSQLSERFRILKNDGLTQGRSGMWHQVYSSDVDFTTGGDLNHNINTHHTINKFGFDHVANFKGYDVMRGVYFGYGLVQAKYDDNIGHNKLKNTSLGMYGAIATHSGFYYEADIGFDLYKSELTAYIDGGDDEMNADAKARSLGVSLAAGKKFNLKNDWLVDTNVKVDYTLYHGNDFTTSNDLRVKQGGYYSLGAIGSILVGKYFNSGKTIAYSKFDTGYYYSSHNGKGFITDLISQGSFDFDTPEYNLYYGNMVLGLKHRINDVLELSLEGNRYFLRGANNLNMGVRGELRYLF
ncbi:autotransporter outer membrane beta-barrel domain-containing protein [Helicobacter winghamensis]